VQPSAALKFQQAHSFQIHFSEEIIMVQTIVERPRFGNLRAAPNHSLGEVVAVLRNRASGFHDEVVDVRNVTMSPDDGSLHVGREATELQPWALSQLGSKLGIPGNYLAKCEPEIRAQNVNHWLGKESGKLLLRMDGNEVRAVLSTRYQSVSTKTSPCLSRKPCPRTHPSALNSPKRILNCRSSARAECRLTCCTAACT
jgi:hypothetical protein